MENPTTIVSRQIKEDWFNWDIKSKHEKLEGLIHSIAHLRHLEQKTQKELRVMRGLPSVLSLNNMSTRADIVSFHRIHHMLVIQLVSLKSKRQFLEHIAFALKQNLENQLDILQML